MVPLTDVEIRSHEDPAQCVVRPVLIVNAAHVRRLISDGPQRASTSSEPEVAATSAEPPASPMAATGSVIAETPAHALVVLLEAGVIDVPEFQAMRARIAVAAAGS